MARSFTTVVDITIKMRIAILRPIPQFSFSMDVYADGLIGGLKQIKPDWEIIEFAPVLSNPKGNPILRGIDKYYQRYWHYPQLLRQQLDIDLFHIVDHSDGHLLYWLKKLHQPTVITCHDLINLTQPDTFTGRSLVPLISMASWKFAVAGIQYADRSIAVSSHTAQDMTEYLNIPSSEISVIPNAVDAKFKTIPSEEIKAFRQHQGISDDDFCLLNVGSNNLRKNIDSILRAIAILKTQNLPIHFWKAGANFNADQQKFIVEHNLLNCVTYLGKPSPKELIQLYNAADVLVAPSLYEGFGLTILEAMSCRTPVITSNVTSLPEVAGEAAILIEPRDIQGIVTAVSRLYSEPLYRQSLIDKGLARVKQFTWSNTATQVAQVYQLVT